MATTLEPSATRAGRRDGHGHIVAVAFPSTGSQRASLSGTLGSGWEVLDIRDAPSDASVVLLRPCSPATLGRVLEEFPSAGVVVTGAGAGALVCRCRGRAGGDHLCPSLADAVLEAGGGSVDALYPSAA
jgi:hypothetical protein